MQPGAGLCRTAICFGPVWPAPWVAGPHPGLRVNSRDVCFSLDYGWRVLLDPPMPAGRSTETPLHQSLVRHGAGALWCLQRFGDSRRCEKSGRIHRARPGRGRIPRPALSSGSALPSPVRGPLTRWRDGPRTGLRMEALRAQRRRFHAGSLGDGQPRQMGRKPGLR
jgi:hypothetical protein